MSDALVLVKEGMYTALASHARASEKGRTKCIVKKLKRLYSVG